MDRDSLDELMAQARTVAGGKNPDGVVQRIDSALAVDPEPWEAGTLLLIKSIAMQCLPDPMQAAIVGRAAFDELRKTDDVAKAAYAAAAGAVLVHRTGDVARAVDLAVEAMILLPDTDPGSPDALSATNALAQVFSALSAYDLAVEMAEHAFRGSAHLPMTVRGHYAYALATCATDACYSVEDSARGLWLTLIGDAADYLLTDDVSPVSPIIACGMWTEVAILSDDEQRARTVWDELLIDRPDDLADYPLIGDRLVPWHRLVRAAAARRWGDPAVAVALLEQAVPQLETNGETMRLARAMEERAKAYAAVGRPDRAIDDALDLVRRSRSWQTEQIGRLAGQISERADLERKRGQLIRQADLLAQEAAVDTVTGVSTRRWLEVKLNDLSRTSGPVAVIMVDLDHFKGVNDTFGHAVGDQVLGRVGTTLKSAARAGDGVARYGGEEFVVVVEQATSADAAPIAERIRRDLAELDWGRTAPGLRVTTSAGVAHGPARLVRDVLRLADSALYEAKRSGRDRVVVADGAAKTTAGRAGTYSSM